MSWQGQGNITHGLLQQLREDVARLERIVVGDDVPGRIRLTEAVMIELRDHVEELQLQMERALTAAEEMAALTRRMDARVLWLERRVRLSEAPVVELDDVDEELVRLAGAADAGYRAHLALLTEAARRQLQAAVAAFTAATTATTAEQDRAVAAALVLAGTPLGSPEHRGAGVSFRTARSRMEAAEAEATRTRHAGQQAQQQLCHDDASRAESQDVIARGERARVTLHVRLRTAVAEAVGTASLLPSWFTAALGPMPSEENTDRWMDTAVGLLTYRITFHVGDPVVALGPRPGPESDRHRREWWHELDAALRRLRQ